MITSIWIVVLICVSAITIAFVIRSKFKKDTLTREQYAFKCLTAITSLVILAIASVSSKQGMGDQIFSLVSAILGHPIQDAPSAPISEKALIVILVCIAIYLISESHHKWTGAISVDEINRERMKRSTSLIPQAIREVIRLARSEMKPQIYKEDRRVDPVSIPDEPNLVWYDHARELFELWQPMCSLTGRNTLGWDPVAKCWLGKNRSRRISTFLFCVIEKPDDEALGAFAKHAALTLKEFPYEIYVVYRNFQNLPCQSRTLETLADITLVSEEFLFQNIVDFSDYFSEISRRVESDYFPGSEITLRDIYTTSSVSSDAKAESLTSKDLGAHLAAWSTNPAGKHVVILGEYGQGKSTGALMYAYELIRRKQADAGTRAPILFELRGKSPANLSQHELLAVWAQRYKIHASALMKLLIAGKLIVIFEGFDEMANIATIESRVSHFRSLWRFAYPKSKLVFTGRRNLFFEDQEMNIVFRGATEENTASLCEILYLCPFDERKIRTSLRWVPMLTCEEIINAAKSSSQILDIVARPALLYIVASLWDKLRPLLDAGRITSAQVIDTFILFSYERQEMKEHDLNFMTLTTTERRYFHEGVAVFMAARGATNQIGSVDLRAAVARLYSSYPDGINVSDKVILETARPPLKIRMPDAEEAIDIIVTDVRTHGILVNDLGQRDTFRFAHKSFYELLAAKVHAYVLLDVEPIFYRSIATALDGNIRHSENVPEILNFLSELLISHIRSDCQSTDIGMAIFDLVVGSPEKRSFNRGFTRAYKIAILRLLLNRKVTLTFLILIASVGLLQGVFATDTFQSMIASFPTVATYFHVFARPTAASITSITFLAMLCASAFFTYLNFKSGILVKKANLWAAVLLAGDISMRSRAGHRAITHLLGPAAGRTVIASASRKFNFEFD